MSIEDFNIPTLDKIRLQATLNTLERLKMKYLEGRINYPVSEWKTLEQIIDQMKMEVLAEVKERHGIQYDI